MPVLTHENHNNNKRLSRIFRYAEAYHIESQFAQLFPHSIENIKWQQLCVREFLEEHKIIFLRVKCRNENP